jgi:hypothetical protein
MASRKLRVLLGLALLVCAGAARAEGAWSFQSVPRVVSIGDVHGAYAELERVLEATKLVDEQGRWSGGATHLVSLGDLVDRGPDSRKVLDLLMRLFEEAPQRGGYVHVLLGNHEAMVLAGDRRYVSPADYETFGGKAGYLAAFSPAGRYGGWLLERNAVIRIGDVVFVHGGLAPVLAELGAEEVNRRLREELRVLIEGQQALVAAGVFEAGADLGEQMDAVGALLTPDKAATLDPELLAHARRLESFDRTLAFDPAGPLWYRGTAENPEPEERPLVDAVLGKLGAKRAVIGHTPTPDLRVRTRFDGRVVLADTGMLTAYYGGHPAAVELVGGAVTAIYPLEDKTEEPRPVASPEPAAAPEAAPVPSATPAPSDAPKQETRKLTDPEIENFLATAQVVASKELGTGITNPKRLTLRMGTQEMRAVFKYVDSIIGETTTSNDRLARLNQSDSWRYEIAAYKLDRMIGLNLVPVTVVRTVEGKTGAVQLWIEGAIDEGERVKMKLKPPDQAAFDETFRRMRMFDALIFNEDRHQGNVLYTTADWKVHAIDHTRAFRTRTSFPPDVRHNNLTPPPEMAERMAALDVPKLKAALGEWLDDIQIRAVLKRRDQILSQSGKKK